jgi:hypothetical protein
MEPLLSRLARAGFGRESGGFGGVVIHVKSGHGVDPYFDIPMPKFMNEWQKMWFFLRNIAVALLPVFTGNHPIPQPN